MIRARAMSAFLLALLFAGPARSAGASDEMTERHIVKAFVMYPFNEGDFSTLDSLYAKYRSPQERTPSGLWKLSSFYAAFFDLAVPQDPSAGVRLHSRLAEWRSKSPKSPAPYIARAVVELRQAYRLRKSSPTVYQQRVAAVRSDLETHKQIASADPAWYEQMMLIARAQAWTHEEFSELLREAMDREPGFYQMYFAALQYLLPSRHGTIEQIESLADEAVRRTKTQEGNSMYARIYWSVAQTEYGTDLFSKSWASWEKMKLGFESVMARYPDAWNQVNFAGFACDAGDTETVYAVLFSSKYVRLDQLKPTWPQDMRVARCASEAFMRHATPEERARLKQP